MISRVGLKEKVLKYLDMPRINCFHLPLIFSVSEVDNGFLELYGGLLNTHMERRKAHFLRSRSTHATSAGAEEGPPEEKKIGIDPVVKELDPEEVRALCT